jgi:hypothetical protein
LPAAHLANGVDTSGDNLGADTGVDELLCKLADYRCKNIGRGELVDRLSESNQDKCNLELVVGEVLDNVRVESKNTELVRAHDTREELHDEHLMLERVLLVVAVEHVVELLAKGLGVVEQLESGEVD